MVRMWNRKRGMPAWGKRGRERNPSLGFLHAIHWVHDNEEKGTVWCGKEDLGFNYIIWWPNQLMHTISLYTLKAKSSGAKWQDLLNAWRNWIATCRPNWSCCWRKCWLLAWRCAGMAIEAQSGGVCTSWCGEYLGHRPNAKTFNNWQFWQMDCN